MELDFENDFTASVVTLFYYLGVLVMAVIIFLDALPLASNLFIAVMATITAGFCLSSSLV